ncbi:DrmB family protein [Microbulbifer sp. VAAC004]|uniref:DrmB family protein n=1 Tax=unclassified Microbulbifer TaxID=2619833 RepID=UPI00403AF9C2
MAGRSSKERRVRKSQLISTFGVGAIMEFPQETLMHAGIEAWQTGPDQELVDDRLARRLGVDVFYEPIQAPEKDIPGGTVPFVRFPLWQVCPRCRTMQKVEWNDRAPRRCSSTIKPRSGGQSCSGFSELRRPKLTAVRFITACEDGHIDDFPWVEWAHTPRKEKLTRGAGCSNPNLRLSATGRAGLMGLNVECLSCGSKRSMMGAGSPDILKEYGCTGSRPWLGPDSADPCSASHPPRVLQRGATNVYFSQVVSSILIPPHSTAIRRLIARTKFWNFLCSGSDDGRADPARLEQFSEMHDVSLVELTEAVNERLGMINESSKDLTEDEFRLAEYKAFLSGRCQNQNDDLNLSPQSVTDYDPEIQPYFDNIVLIEKLTETRALTGFSRLNPPGSSESGQQSIAALSKNKRNWYPAVRAFGEGIFITLNQKLLDEWTGREQVQRRSEQVQQRLNDVNLSRSRELRQISPAFLLLHTLAHLLIRRLSFDCGYGSSSLRERLYCVQNGKEKMSGILIYTAASDAEGTLGGLVLQGKKDHLEQTLRNALVDAANCSSDPLCTESSGQGSDTLNLAACHACALIPETSCEEGNRLLDRLMVIGEPEDESVGFFGDLLNAVVKG